MPLIDLKEWMNALQGDAVIDQIVIDTRRIDSSRAAFVALEGKDHDGHNFVEEAARKGARFAIVKKNYCRKPENGQIRLIHVEDPLQAMQNIARLHRQKMPAKVVAITGSQGKTMVKDLVASLCFAKGPLFCSPESFNSQLGVALSLLQIEPHHKLAIIEAGISQMGEMDRLKEMICPDFALLTHIGWQHIDTLKDQKTIVDEKMRLLLGAKEWVLLPQHPLLDPYLQQLPIHYFINDCRPSMPCASFCGLNKRHNKRYRIAFPEGGHLFIEQPSCIDYFLPLINTALKCSHLLGATKKEMEKVLRCLHLEPMQTEIWHAPSGAAIINCAYLQDPISLKPSLKMLEETLTHGKRYFLFDGLKKNGKSPPSDSCLQHYLQNKSLDALYFTSKGFKSLEKKLRKSAPQLTVGHYPSLEKALRALQKTWSGQDTVLIQGKSKYSIDQKKTFECCLGPNRLHIHVSALDFNIATIRQNHRNKTGQNARLMVMVKATGYGTDSAILSQFLFHMGVDILGVAHVDEAVALKQAHVRQSVFAINAALYEIEKAVYWDVEVGVSDLATIQALQKEAKRQKKLQKVHLHIDTGMSRFGCRPFASLFLAQQIAASSHLTFEGVMTHFAAADDPLHDEFTLSQIENFHKMLDQLDQMGISPRWRHAANSSASIRFALPRLNMLRIGLAVFGISPLKQPPTLPLLPVLSLTSKIAGINICHRGETISYGRSYRVEREKAVIAILPLGYFDGLHRRYSGKAEVLIRGKKAPMVGAICMDYMMIDITDIPKAAVGDPVIIFGRHGGFEHLSVSAFAEKGDTNAYELITCLGPRIQRIFIQDDR